MFVWRDSVFYPSVCGAVWVDGVGAGLSMELVPGKRLGIVCHPFWEWGD